MARANRESMSTLDTLIGIYAGADKISTPAVAVCAKEPRCGVCVVTPYCSYFKYIEKPFDKKPEHVQETKNENPREKLALLGSDALSNAELLAIILRTGTRETSVLELAKALLRKFSSLEYIDKASISEISSLKGIGKIKAIEIKAALQLSKRLISEPISQSHKITCSADLFNVYRTKFSNVMQEVFYLLMLDIKNMIIREVEILAEPAILSILSDRRKFAPYGLFGGKDGAKGANYLIRNEKKIALKGKTTMPLQKGDIIIIQTPGGGGYGEEER